MSQEDRQDLTQLKQELIALSENNNQLAINLEISDHQLTEALAQLETSEAQITRLEMQLKTAKEKTLATESLSRTAESDLIAANKSLDEWKKEQDREIAKLKRENKTYQLILIAVAFKTFIKN